MPTWKLCRGEGPRDCTVGRRGWGWRHWYGVLNLRQSPSDDRRRYTSTSESNPRPDD